MKVGLIGAGYWGPNLARVLNQTKQADFVSVCDLDPVRLEKIKRTYHIHGYDTLHAMLASDVDAVLVATPISTHYDIAKEALLHGKHVFVEKPLAHRSDLAEDLVTIADRQGLTLMCGHTFIYSPPVRKIKELIDGGSMGELYYMSLSRVNLGLYQQDVDVVWDLAVHEISIMLYWLGEMPIRSHMLGRACVRDKNDIAFLWLEFPSGVIAQCEVSWLSPQKLRRTAVVGSQRMVVYDDMDPSEKVRIYDKGVDVREPESFGEFQLSYRTGDMVAPHLNNVEPLMVEVEHFIQCCSTGATPMTDGRFGTNVIKVLEDAIQSPVENKDRTLAVGARQ